MSLCASHLGHPPELHESIVGEKPAGLAQYSASSMIPLLVHDDLVLTESRVILEHLTDHYAYADAYPAELGARSRHRHAMAVVDTFFVPLLFGRMDAEVDDLQLEDGLRALEEATASGIPQPHLLAIHVAPIWLRFRLWQPAHIVTRAIEARTALCRWLNTAVELDCLSRTAPDPVTHQEDVVRARQAGLLPGLK